MRKWQRFIGLAGLVLVLVGCATSPQTWNSTPQPGSPSTADVPILQIDSGGHTSLIRDIAFTRDGRFLVSAGDDKQVRVWDWASGKTVRTIRGQVGEGDEGKIYAMALSPDNRYLAVGGMFHNTDPVQGSVIRLYDFASGKLLALLKGHTNVVFSLAFSADSRWLVSGSGDSTAIVWDVAKRESVQPLTGHTDDIYAVAFTPDNARVVTGSDDHTLKLWRRADGDLIETLRDHTDKVQAVAVTPAGEVLSGSWGHSIRRWDGRTGASRGVLVADQGTQIGSLSVSTDGRFVLSGVGDGPNNDTHLYRLSDGERVQRYQGHDNIVLATAFSPDGRLAATAGGGDRSIHLWDVNTGKLEKRLVGDGQAVWSVGFSADGQRLPWGKQGLTQINQAGKLEYQIQLPGPNQPLTNPAKLNDASGFIRAQALHGSRRLYDRPSSQWGYSGILEITEDGNLINKIERNATNGYRHRAYSFTPDGQHIISGASNGVLSLYDANGDKQGDFVGHTGDIWSVAVSPDGRLLASGSADQTVRLWRIESQELLLSLFQAEDGEWVAWTPQGYFAASPDGEDMIGWQINRGSDKAADYASGRQLRAHFYRPDIVAAAIQLGSAEQAVAQADGTDFVLADLLQAPPPAFEIVGTDWEPTSGAPLLHIDIKVTRGSIKSYQVFLDGRRVETIKGLRSDHLPADGAIRRVSVTVADFMSGTGASQLTMTATDQRGLAADTQSIRTKPLPDALAGQAGATKGDLYLVSIGVNQYPFLDKDLKYAKQDAAAFHAWVLQNHAADFNAVHDFLLHDDAPSKPTKRRIEEVLDELKSAKPEDTVILFMAGHGATDNKQYYFLGSNTERDGDAFAPDTAIHWTKIQDSLMQADGLRILVVDTCYARGAFNPPINDLYHQRIAVFSATNSIDYVAREEPTLGHGIFTYNLLQGLQGKADSVRHRPDRQITLSELKSYVRDEVKHHTNAQQIPAIYLNQQIEDYVIARWDNAAD